MPRKQTPRQFIEAAYRHLARHADSDRIKLIATDRLTVLYKFLDIPLFCAEPLKNNNSLPESGLPTSPADDLDKQVAAMREKHKQSGGENANQLSESTSN